MAAQAQTAYAYSVQQAWYIEGIAAAAFQFSPNVVANGRSTAILEIGLPHNAVVRALDIELRADRAEWTAIGNVGQVRVQDISTASAELTSVVVDFGVPRTVAGVGVKQGTDLGVLEVKMWNGLGFAENKVPTVEPSYAMAVLAGSGDKVALFTAEIQTQRLQIRLAGKADADVIEQAIAAQLPELPADLELRIDEGAPVFTHLGAVEDGQNGWVKGADGRTTRTVALAAALAPLTGDAKDPSSRTFKLTLTARTPGLLDLTEAVRQVDRIWATDLGPEGRALEFAEEGFVDVPLTLPDNGGTLKEVRVTVAANLPPERAVPAVGPPAGGRADLVLAPDRAVCLALPLGTGLQKLTALRLPLRAGRDGAEARVAFLAGAPGAAPGEALPTPQSKPVVLEPASNGSAGDDEWIAFELDGPLPLDGAAPPWLAVFVSRGEIYWSVATTTIDGSATGAARPLALTDIRRGPAGGPWEPLPPFLSSPPGSAARLHLIGHASKERPLAPLRIEACAAAAPWDPFDAAHVPVTPVAKGVRATCAALLPFTGAASLVLRLTARAPGTITLRDLEAVVSDD